MLNDLREAKDAAKRYARKMGMSHREWHLEPMSAEKFGVAMKQALYGQLGEKVPRGRLFGDHPRYAGNTLSPAVRERTH